MERNEWLIRTAGNWIMGPYTRDEVCDLVSQRKLKKDDEVCQANQYWFSLKEREQVIKYLKIDPPEWPESNDAAFSEERTLIDVRSVTGVSLKPGLPPQERRPFWRGAIWFLFLSFLMVLFAFIRLWRGMSVGTGGDGGG